MLKIMDFRQVYLLQRFDRLLMSRHVKEVEAPFVFKLKELVHQTSTVTLGDSQHALEDPVVVFHRQVQGWKLKELAGNLVLLLLLAPPVFHRSLFFEQFFAKVLVSFHPLVNDLKETFIVVDYHEMDLRYEKVMFVLFRLLFVLIVSDWVQGYQLERAPPNLFQNVVTFLKFTLNLVSLLIITLSFQVSSKSLRFSRLSDCIAYTET